MRLKIAAKIGLGFGIITLALVVNAIFTSKQLASSQEVNNRISEVYSPSLGAITQLREKIYNSKMLVKSWVFIDKKSDTPDKLALIELHEVGFPALDNQIKELSTEWNEQDMAKAYLDISTAISDTLFDLHKFVMTQLNSFESYSDFFNEIEVVPLASDDGEILILTDKILNRLDVIEKSLAEIETSGRSQVLEQFKRFKSFIIIMAAALLFIAFINAAIVIRSLTRPINNTKNVLSDMSLGILPKEKMKEGRDELGQMAKALNALVNAQRSIADFAIEIGKGNFSTGFKALSADDTLGNSLIEMRNELKKAADEDIKRREEDEQRKWATEGVGKFSGIMRNGDKLSELSYDIISNLVKYLDANQGGMFLVNDSDPHKIFLEMSACYAFSRKKFLSKKVEIGEGLVGRCVQEKDYIYLTEIPDDYINITSGLGNGNPKSLLLVPLIYNDELFGVIEIASFHEIKTYQIDFVKLLSESIAATILSLKSNIRTSELLEQSQQQAEEMAAQEEEMRQNMEELRATQEQSMRRENEYREEIERLKKKLKENEISV